MGKGQAEASPDKVGLAAGSSFGTRSCHGCSPNILAASATTDTPMSVSFSNRCPQLPFFLASFASLVVPFSPDGSGPSTASRSDSRFSRMVALISSIQKR
jgi:hypothetical protein